MRAFVLVLQLFAPLFFVVGALHLVLGLQAEVLLGAHVPPEAMADATLNSQNRFYGVAFSLYGVLLFLCATNVPKYSSVLRCAFWVFFAAGLARLVSIATHGVPPPLIITLLVIELLGPLLLLWWLGKVTRGSNR